MNRSTTAGSATAEAARRSPRSPLTCPPLPGVSTGIAAGPPAHRRGPLGTLAVLLALTLSIGGCAALYQTPEVRITDVRVVGLGLASGTAELDVEVDNPNRFALEVRGLEYLFEVSDGADTPRWDTLATGFSADTVRIERRSSERVTLRIPFRYQALGVALRSWLSGGEIPYRVEGEILARGLGGQRDLPFRSEGRFTP